MDASLPSKALCASDIPELEALRPRAKKASFKAGSVIFREGDQGNVLYIIDKGCVQISSLIGGSNRRVLARFGAGEYFGEMAVVDRQRRSATAKAEVETVVSVISGKDLWRMAERSPGLMIGMVRNFSLRMREFDRRYLHALFEQERWAVIGRFAQSIVHDFKNPLNNIGFGTKLICAKDAKQEERVQVAVLIRKEVAEMENLMHELLEFTRPSRKPLVLEKTNIRDFVRAVVNDLEREAALKSISIQVKRPPDIELPINRQRLARVFKNLISNAINFTPRHGRITLRFAMTRDSVATKVEDTGAGISPDMLGRLFMPFVTDGRCGGTGLGLSICKRIVEDHGGTISAQSKLGRGAVFIFSLPRKRGTASV